MTVRATLRRWLSALGPGAVIASLTIGAGELVFSTRAGALFGYRPLLVFLGVLVCKWALVFAATRHAILTGAHPFERWMALRGPRGWLPCCFLLFAALCFPIWVAFHAGTLGTLLAHLTGTADVAAGRGHLLWGFGALTGSLILCLYGGYTTLERIQTVIVGLMLACVTVSLVLLRPDWIELLQGLLVPAAWSYPDWVTAAAYPAIAARPPWVEASTYVGIIGGSSFDYLAYVAYAREKGWIRESEPPVEASGVVGSAIPAMRAMTVDCALSFVAVLAFTVVFVAGGHLLLAPRHLVPEGTNLLTLQAALVGPLGPGFTPLYYAGALLTIGGTLYGTLEVAPAVWGEFRRALHPGAVPRGPAGRDGVGRRVVLLWVGVGGLLVLAAMMGAGGEGADRSPPALIALLTPANLFTGVLGCGVVCLLNVWVDRGSLQASGGQPGWLAGLNLVAGLGFVALGLKAYWDHGGYRAYLMLIGTVGAGWMLAVGLEWSRRWRNRGE